jgi:hypothetical protein
MKANPMHHQNTKLE